MKLKIMTVTEDVDFILPGGAAAIIIDGRFQGLNSDGKGVYQIAVLVP